MQTYATLEARVSAQAEDWTIQIQPPAIALPDLVTKDGALDAKSNQDLALIAWAAKRVGLPLGINGTPENLAIAEPALTEKNIPTTRKTDIAIPSRGVRLKWLTPDEVTAP